MYGKEPQTVRLDYSHSHAPNLMRAMHALGEVEEAAHAHDIETHDEQALRGLISTSASELRDHLEALHQIHKRRTTDA